MIKFNEAPTRGLRLFCIGAYILAILFFVYVILS